MEAEVLPSGVISHDRRTKARDCPGGRSHIDRVAPKEALYGSWSHSDRLASRGASPGEFGGGKNLSRGKRKREVAAMIGTHTRTRSRSWQQTRSRNC